MEKEEIKKMLQEAILPTNECDGFYIYECKDCNAKFKTQKECAEHCNNEKHYSFRLKGTKLNLGFV